MTADRPFPEFLRKDNGIGRPADTRTSAERKAQPVWSGCFQYFPDALAAVAELSKAGNDKHNPGEPLHWSREKSSDHADCVGRHLIDLGPDWTDVDHEDGLMHAQKLAWRALAVLQIAIERRRAKRSSSGTCGPMVGASLPGPGYGKPESGWIPPVAPMPDGRIK